MKVCAPHGDAVEVADWTNTLGDFYLHQALNHLNHPCWISSSNAPVGLLIRKRASLCVSGVEGMTTAGAQPNHVIRKMDTFSDSMRHEE